MKNAIAEKYYNITGIRDEQERAVIIYEINEEKRRVQAEADKYKSWNSRL